MKYRVQLKDSDGKWYTLKLTDVAPITKDSEARAVVRSFNDRTGNEYRAQFQAGRRWIPVMMF
jgi:hypothetical protein